MKKIAALFIIGSVLLTGCGKNRLVCKQTKEIDGIESTETYTFVFQEEEVKTAALKNTIKLSGDYNTKEFIQQFKDSAQESADIYNETNGVTAKVSTRKNKITLNVEMQREKMSEEDQQYFELDLTKEELKENLEGNGYSCK